MKTRFLILLVIFSLSLPLAAFAQDDVDLPQDFTSQDGTLSFSYPEDWFATDATDFVFPLVVATNTESRTDLNWLLQGVPMIEPEEAVILFWSPIVATAIGIDPTAYDTLTDFAVAAADDMEGGMFDEKGEPEEVTLGESEAIRIDGTGESYANTLFFLDTAGGYLTVMVFTAPDAYADYAAEVEALLASVGGAEIAEGATLTFAGDRFSFDYPAGWIAFPVMDGYVAGASTVAAIEENTPPSGSLLYAFADGEGLATLFMMEDVDFSAETLEGFGAFATDSGEIGEIEETTIGDFPALRATGGSEDVESLMILLDVGDGEVVAFMARAFPGELADWEEAIMQLLETFSYGME